jgi:hypothetical protein
MFLKCIKGYPGLLEEGQIYEAYMITENGHFVLVGVNPPPPHTCFNKNRFVPIDIDEINIKEVLTLAMEL